MTRQAFLAQMPDPLSFRPFGIFSFPSSRFLLFSLLATSSSLLRSLPAPRLRLSCARDLLPLSLLLLLSRFRSLARSRWVVSLLLPTLGPI